MAVNNKYTVAQASQLRALRDTIRYYQQKEHLSSKQWERVAYIKMKYDHIRKLKVPRTAEQ